MHSQSHTNKIIALLCLTQYETNLHIPLFSREFSDQHFCDSNYRNFLFSATVGPLTSNSPHDHWLRDYINNALYVWSIWIMHRFPPDRIVSEFSIQILVGELKFLLGVLSIVFSNVSFYFCEVTRFFDPDLFILLYILV